MSSNCPLPSYNISVLKHPLISFCDQFLWDFFRSLVQMRSSYGGGLTFLFTALTSQLSLPSSLTLTNSNLTDPSAPLLLTAQNSTSLNTFPSVSSKSGITCMKVHGENLKTDSCRNAWQKIPRTPNTQRFIPRKRSGEASSADVVLPIRYLSDDGICAIVRRPCFSLALYSNPEQCFKAVKYASGTKNTSYYLLKIPRPKNYTMQS